jgi:hypothetical protein
MVGTMRRSRRLRSARPVLGRVDRLQLCAGPGERAPNSAHTASRKSGQPIAPQPLAEEVLARALGFLYEGVRLNVPPSWRRPLGQLL